MAELIIASGTMKGQRLVLPDREVIVGRDEECHMRIASSLISRKHCALKGAPHGIWVRDLESQNGTYVNDVAITDPFLMKPGDVLRIGSSLFQVPRPRPVHEDDSGGFLDDDISTWLSEDSPTESSALPDTTVIKGRQAAAPAPASSAAAKKPAISEAETASALSTPTPPPRTTPTIRQPPRTVKEQAAEIIRRHWEIVREQQPE